MKNMYHGESAGEVGGPEVRGVSPRCFATFPSRPASSVLSVPPRGMPRCGVVVLPWG